MTFNPTPLDPKGDGSYIGPDGAGRSSTVTALVHGAALDGRTLVAFTGRAGAGKSTAAFHLVERHGWVRMRFAGPLKSMMAALGLSGAEIEGDRKEVPSDLLCGKTPRFAMQTIGTEWGRDLIGEDLWIRAWRKAFERTLPGSCVVVDDCRFPNEVEAIRSAGGIIVNVDRVGVGARSGMAGHASETHDLPFDLKIQNEGAIESFFTSIETTLRVGYSATS